MYTAVPMILGVTAIQPAATESMVPEVSVGLFALWVVWNVIKEYLPGKTSGELNLLHKSECTETLHLMRGLKSKLDELVILMRERNK